MIVPKDYETPPPALKHAFLKVRLTTSILAHFGFFYREEHEERKGIKKLRALRASRFDFLYFAIGSSPLKDVAPEMGGGEIPLFLSGREPPGGARRLSFSTLSVQPREEPAMSRKVVLTIIALFCQSPGSRGCLPRPFTSTTCPSASASTRPSCSARTASSPAARPPCAWWCATARTAPRWPRPRSACRLQPAGRRAKRLPLYSGQTDARAPPMSLPMSRRSSTPSRP